MNLKKETKPKDPNKFYIHDIQGYRQLRIQDSQGNTLAAKDVRYDPKTKNQKEIEAFKEEYKHLLPQSLSNSTTDKGNVTS